MCNLKALCAGVGLLATVGMVAGCENPSTALSGSMEPRLGVSTTEPPVLHPGEAVFEEIAKKVPSFAGFFFEGQTVVVNVTESGQALAAEAAVRDALAERVWGGDEPQPSEVAIVVRSVAHTFRQLRDWRNRIEEEVLFTLPDASSIDLDEANNKVVIGLVDGSGKAQVEEALARLAVPPQAARVRITGPFLANDRLWDRVRPVIGGLAQGKITFEGGQDSLFPWCTYSSNARYNGVDVILTASHCTDRIYHADAPATIFYQNTVTAGNLIGSEWYDPLGFGACAGPGGYYQYCQRYSDAVMIRHEPGVSFDLGFIARTTFRGIGWGEAGSTTIDPANPRFRISYDLAYPQAGWQVNKVGRTTGWTTGTIFEDGTCLDVFSAGYWRLCTYIADYFSGDGDSGAPVFRWGGGENVTLVGIHWGNNETDGYSAFSPMGGVYQDFGSMTVRAPAPPPPPMTVTISGPSTWPAYQQVTVQAFVSNGTPPFTYAWQVNGSPYCGNQSWCTKTMGGPGTSVYFYVTVTDSQQQQATDYHVVTAQ